MSEPQVGRDFRPGDKVYLKGDITRTPGIVLQVYQSGSFDLDPCTFVEDPSQAVLIDRPRYRDEIVPCGLREQSGSHPNAAIKAREPIKHEEWCKCECGAQDGK